HGGGLARRVISGRPPPPGAAFVGPDARSRSAFLRRRAGSLARLRAAAPRRIRRESVTALVRIFAEAIADRYRAGGRALGGACERGRDHVGEKDVCRVTVPPRPARRIKVGAAVKPSQAASTSQGAAPTRA